MNSSTHQQITKAQRNLAAGILSQARRDLRRFRSSRRALGRELYLDAYNWVISRDTSWPLSFRNVCYLLEVSPEEVREEVLRDTSLATADYWSRQCARLLRQCQTSLREMFAREHYLNPAQTGAFAHVVS
jgi:hypothetical protein